MATRKPKTLHFWRGDLPNWQVENGRYFVTIHLNDALPQVAHQKMRELFVQNRLDLRFEKAGKCEDYLA